MTFNETAVIVVGLLAGYWIIDALMGKKPRVQKNKTFSEGSGGNAQSPVNEVTAAADYDKYISNNWFRILGVAEDANPEQIITAYHQMLAENQPDSAANMSAEFRELTAFKTRQIKDAYNYAMSMMR